MIWLLILGPWLTVALMATGMAFEGGYTLDAYLSLVSFWAYPVLVVTGWLLGRKWPALVFLPLLTVVPFGVEHWLWHAGVRVVFAPAQ